MSREGIYLIEAAEWFGYCNMCSTIEQIDKRTGTERVFVPTLDSRSRIRSQCTSTLFCISG